MSVWSNSFLETQTNHSRLAGSRAQASRDQPECQWLRLGRRGRLHTARASVTVRVTITEYADPDHLGPARALALRTRRIPCPYASGHTGSLAAAAHWHITRKTLLEPQAPDPGHWHAGSGHRYISDSDIVESLTS